MKQAPRKKVQAFNHSELAFEPDKLAIVKRCEAELAKLGRRTTEGKGDLTVPEVGAQGSALWSDEIPLRAQTSSCAFLARIEPLSWGT